MQAGIALFKAGDDAGDAALFDTVLQNGQRCCAVKHQWEVNGGNSACQSDFQCKGMREMFVQAEVGDHKGLCRQSACRQSE
ncbi:hypothetical protein Xsto_03839 [Xenorhabdus stockiae]|uniref:Uncharacterized protein n=1 Tax=Xenorhabdus stockiae TaxID=351614 RepID=A0A2D0KB69_9GAMM|nr:hypothetical protein Xsto_03839 [Xenorhabdus stockiae]